MSIINIYIGYKKDKYERDKSESNRIVKQIFPADERGNSKRTYELPRTGIILSIR